MPKYYYAIDRNTGRVKHFRTRLLRDAWVSKFPKLREALAARTKEVEIYKRTAVFGLESTNVN